MPFRILAVGLGIGSIVVSLSAQSGPTSADSRTALAYEQLAEAELALTRLNFAEARRIVDAWEESAATWKNYEPKEVVLDGWRGNRAADIRFIASVFAETTTPDELSTLFASRSAELFERFLADGTTLLSPLSYPGLLIRGREDEAARGFERMATLLAGDPVRLFRLQATRLSTLAGLGQRDLTIEQAATKAALAAAPIEQVQTLAEYRGYLLTPVFQHALAGDFAAALDALRTALDAHPELPQRDRLERYIPSLEKLITLMPQEEALWAAESVELPRVTFETDRGPLEITLFATDAPESVANFIALVDAGFYDGVAFHRIVPHFVTQGGDPKGTGDGGPGYAIKREVGRHHARGSLGMARDAAPDTAGSQFYFCLNAVSVHRLDGNYAVFGRVSAGLDVMDQLRLGDKIIRATVSRRGAPLAPFTQLPES